MDVEGTNSVQSETSLDLQNGVKTTLDDIKDAVPILIDNIDTSKTILEGSIKIKVEHESITDEYNQSFTISGIELSDAQRSDFPTSSGNVAIYTDTWPATESALDTTDDATTFTVPSGVDLIRVVLYGAGGSLGSSTTASNGTDAGDGGYTDAIIPVPDNQSDLKVIVADSGNPSSNGRGGHGAGGGGGPDVNSTSVGGGGTAIAWSSNPDSNGFAVAGGGGTWGPAHGSGGNADDGYNNPNSGASSDGSSGGFNDGAGNFYSGEKIGIGGTFYVDDYGRGYGTGTGGGAGAGGSSGDSSGSPDGEDAPGSQGWGGLGGNMPTSTGPGHGGVDADTAGLSKSGGGGNGLVIDGDNIGGGGSASHGDAQSGGGYAGGGGGYYEYGGGGGSGHIYPDECDDNIQSKYVDPSNVTTSQGSLLDLNGQSGTGRSTSVPTDRGQSTQDGLVVIMW